MAETNSQQFTRIEVELGSTRTKVDELRIRCEATATTVAANDARLKTVEGDVGTIKTDLSWYTGAFKALVGALTIFSATLLFLANSCIRETARSVLHESQGKQTNFTQTGKWTAGNRLPGDAYAFKWDLAEPIGNRAVVSAVTSPLRPIPRVVATAAVSEDGKSCIMRLRGAQESLDSIELPVDAMVTITTRNK